MQTTKTKPISIHMYSTRRQTRVNLSRVSRFRRHIDSVIFLDSLLPSLVISGCIDPYRRLLVHINKYWKGCLPLPSPICATVSSIGILRFFRSCCLRSKSSTSGSILGPLSFPPVNSYAAKIIARPAPIPSTLGVEPAKYVVSNYVRISYLR